MEFLIFGNKSEKMGEIGGLGKVDFGGCGGLGEVWVWVLWCLLGGWGCIRVHLRVMCCVK